MVIHPSLSDRHTGPRIALCSADVGCGHGRAAAAISLSLRNHWPGAQVTILDALSTTPFWFNCIYREAYLFSARHLPTFNGWLYDAADKPGIQDRPDVGRRIEAFALRRFCESPIIANADLLVCTHFLCARVFSRLRAEGKINKPIAVVVTDQHPHAVWRVSEADLYIVGSEGTRTELVRHGVPPERIVVTGIPIDERFHTPLPKRSARIKLRLPETMPILLLSGGGLGLGGIDRALEGIQSTGLDVFTVAVCARNERLRQQLLSRYGTDHPRCRILGVTTRMHELMAAADLHVGKPGGLTTAESTAMGLPLVLLRPIPGQEERNADTLVKAGAAIRCDDPYEAGVTAALTVTRDDQIRSLRTSAGRFGRPTSAHDASRAIMTLLGDRSAPSSHTDVQEALEPALHALAAG